MTHDAFLHLRNRGECGTIARHAVDDLAQYQIIEDPAARPVAVDGATLAKQLAEPMEALIVPLMANYDAVLFPATTTGKNAAPRVAAKLDVRQLSGVTGVQVLLKRPR